MGNAIEQLKRCRNRGVPLVSITTIDDHATADTIVDALAGDDPILTWSLAAGWAPRNEAAGPALARMTEGSDPYDPPAAAALRAASKAPPGSALVALGAHHWQADKVAEAWIRDLRNPFEATGRTLILTGPSFAAWGPDVGPHVEPLDDEPPDDAARETAIRAVLKDAETPEPDDATIRLAVAGTRGLPAFSVRQACALAVDRSGLDLQRLRARWRKAIDSTPGLSVDDTVRKIDELGGLQGIKGLAARLAGSDNPPRAVVLLDEGGKMLAGGGGAGGPGDTSGVSQSIEAALLTEMETTRADGLIAFGVPGSGKSASAQALAAVFGVPIVRLDLGAIKGSLVGQSESNIRRALGTIRALAGRAFWVMTCNEMITIKTELRRRFRAGIYFYDLPSSEERETIRHLYATRYGVPDDPAQWPDLEGWTGAEIQTCAERAHEWHCSPREAGAYVVPISQSSADTIAAMRTAAAGRFHAASYPGTYRGHQQPTQTAAPAVRRFGKEA
jgi:hypothetical protein